MSIPTHISPSNSFSTARGKINTLIDHVDQTGEARLTDLSYFDEFQPSSSSDWDIFSGSPAAPGNITGSGVGYTYEQAGAASSGYYQVSLNGNQAPGSYSGSAYSKRGFPIGSNAGDGWEIHFRTGASWNSVADASMIRAFSIGIINTNTQPSAHATMASHGESYFFEFIKTSIGSSTSIAVNLAKGVGGNNWSTTDISSLVTFTLPGGAIYAPAPWYVLSFKYTTNLLQAFVNGIFVGQVVTPFTFSTGKSMKIGSSQQLTISSAVSGSLITFRTDYVQILGRNTRPFVPLP